MAGHRRRTGKPRRSAAAGQRSAERLAAAVTPEARLAAAFDAFRLVCSRAAKRPDTSGPAVVAMRDAADYLIRMTMAMEGRAR